MSETGERHTHLQDYYGSGGVKEKYVSAVDEGLFELERRAIAQYFVDTDARVLDLGCGAGRTTTVLDEMGYETIGLDITGPLVAYAQLVVPGADFFIGDACSLPFGDEQFEYVLFSYNGIDDIATEEKRYEALREVHRVLAPDGVFVFSSRNGWSAYVPRSFDLEGVARYVEFWSENVRRGLLLSRYKSDTTVTDGPRLRYHIRPGAQVRQLRRCGFDVVDVLRTNGFLVPYFHHPYYVVRKSDS